MKYYFLLVTLVSLHPVVQPAAAVTREAPGDRITRAFAKHDRQSGVVLNHELWTEVLSKTVVDAGYSGERLGRGRKQSWIGSNMRFGNDLPSRYENNRVVLSRFDQQHLDMIRRYRRALEAVPAQLPLASLNRDEQLAYWLNLYNAHALEHVTKHYPATTTRKLRSAPGKPPAGAWHKQSLTVAGIALSLVDIEQQILFPIWDDPIVLYGLWQGAIGGPRLPLRAYTGKRVQTMLRENADEFVNSNRGMRPDGEVLEVSLLYGWGEMLFEAPERIRRHIAAHARPPFSRGMHATKRIEIGLYDWHLADLSGGTHHQGQWNHTAAFVFGLPNSTGNRALGNKALRTDNTHQDMPPQTIELLRNMERFNIRARRARTTIRDCPTGSDCTVNANIDEQQAAESGTGTEPPPNH